MKNNKDKKQFKKAPNPKVGKYHKSKKPISGRYDENYEAKDQKGNLTPINDLSWYVSGEQGLNDVARIPYNIPVGLPLVRDGKIADGVVVIQNDTFEAVPGIAVMDVVPTIGNAKTATDPVNIAFNGMYTWMRRQNSGKWDFDANDVAITVLAVDAIYYTMHWYKRIYATLSLNHQANKYLPKALLEAQGIDYEDLMMHASDFRAALNLRIDRVNALKIPSDLWLFNRHEWLFDNYYIEGPTEKDQIYMYRPAAYYIYGLSEAGPSQLTCHRFLAGATGQDGRLTYVDLIRKLDAMLNPIFDDEDVNLISGFIEKAYEGKVMSIPVIEDNPRIGLIWSEDVLLQFKNAKAWPVRHRPDGPGYYGGFFDITQKQNSASDIRLHINVETPHGGLAVYRDLVSDTAVDVIPSSDDKTKHNLLGVLDEWSKPILLTSSHADVTPGENMINSRLIPAIVPSYSSTDQVSFTYDVLAFGSEWPLAIEYFNRYRDRNSPEVVTASYKTHRAMFYDATTDQAVVISDALLKSLSKISVFKYHPEIGIVARIGSDEVDVETSKIPFFDVDNYALVDANTIAMLHESAIMSMLRVPEISSQAI